MSSSMRKRKQKFRERSNSDGAGPVDPPPIIPGYFKPLPQFPDGSANVASEPHTPTSPTQPHSASSSSAIISEPGSPLSSRPHSSHHTSPGRSPGSPVLFSRSPGALGQFGVGLLPSQRQPPSPTEFAELVQRATNRRMLSEIREANAVRRTDAAARLRHEEEMVELRRKTARLQEKLEASHAAGSTASSRSSSMADQDEGKWRPLVPRLHLWEMDDQAWFPCFLREMVQAALTVAWTTKVPLLQRATPAQLVADVLQTVLGARLRDYTFVDFCSGGGGPTPSIERHLNEAIGSENGAEPVRFVLTDLHPHVGAWEAAARQSPNLTYCASPVDAADVPRTLLAPLRAQGKRMCRLFCLAFHHFDDDLASAILRDTLDTSSEAFAIFELQERSAASFFTMVAFGIGIMVLAPLYALLWGAPWALFWVYVVPAIPFVLVVDGWVSALRTRTPAEVRRLLDGCGPKMGQAELSRWRLRSGRRMFLWPVGYLNYVVGTRDAKTYAEALEESFAEGESGAE